MSNATMLQQHKKTSIADSQQFSAPLQAKNQSDAKLSSPHQLVDHRPQTQQLQALQRQIVDSPRASQLKTMQRMSQASAAAAQLNADVSSLNHALLTGSGESATVQAKADGSSVASISSEAAATQANQTGLPDNLKAGIESLSGMSMDHVNVHYNSSQPAQFNAHAYAQGSDIHVAPGQEKHLPHEAWHVVQQAQGRVKPTMQMKAGVAVNDDAGLEAEADQMGRRALSAGVSQLSEVSFSNNLFSPSSHVLQAQFAGPQFGNANLNNQAYPGHAVTYPGGTRGNTGCGVHNRVITAGERANNGKSKPGSPNNMKSYATRFSRRGGLVRDVALNQASTRIHLINHRFENSGMTQSTAANIFLGSKNANNPRHLHEVETPVINSLAHASEENADYEADMANAQLVPDNDNGGNVVFWADANKPQDHAVPHANLNAVYLTTGVAGGGIQSAQPLPLGAVNPKKKVKKATDGWALRNLIGLPRHLWLNYDVSVNYGGAPPHIAANVLHETTMNTDQTGNIINQGRAARIASFAGWKDNALATDFTNNAAYYYASYRPGNIYYRHNEAAHTIPADG